MSGPSRAVPRVGTSARTVCTYFSLHSLPPSSAAQATSAEYLAAFQQLPKWASSSASAPSSADPTSESSRPPLRVALLLSRPPLLTPTPSPLESTYHAYQFRLRAALSNPLPTSFYFKAGSLPLRRFQRSQHQSDLEIFGPRLAGKEPDVGDLPTEPEVKLTERDHWAKEDSPRGEASLERHPEEEVYCLVKLKGGKGKEKWVFPSTDLQKGEGLDQAARRGMLGVEGDLGGEGMDSWVVTKKPVGMLKTSNTTPEFLVRAHILSGEPKPSPSASWSSLSWLTPDEIRQRLESQGDTTLWESIRGVFGSPPTKAESEVQA